MHLKNLIEISQIICCCSQSNSVQLPNYVLDTPLKSSTLTVKGDLKMFHLLIKRLLQF